MRTFRASSTSASPFDPFHPTLTSRLPSLYMSSSTPNADKHKSIISLSSSRINISRCSGHCKLLCIDHRLSPRRHPRNNGFFFQRRKQPRGHMPRADSPGHQPARSLRRRASASAGRRRVQRGEGPGDRSQVRAAFARHAAESPNAAVRPKRWHERGQELTKQPQGFPVGWIDRSLEEKSLGIRMISG